MAAPPSSPPLGGARPGSPSSMVPAKDLVLLEPFTYLMDNPGKNFRTMLIEAFNIWLAVPSEKLKVITEVVDMLHTASLLIDDIEDNSSLRRGNPVAHLIYGIPSTINCANYVYFLALKKLLELNNPKLVEIYTEELCNLHRGQGLDLHWRDTNTCPNQEDYIDMVNNKTGGLLRLAIKLMQAFGSKEFDFVPLVNALGIHFQIRDDFINLRSDQYMKGKGFCEDITEGKFSFPIIHSIQNDKNHRLINILKQRTKDHEVLNFAVECIKRTKSFEYTVAYIRKTEQEARQIIQSFGGNPALTKILDVLAEIYKEEP